MRFFSIKAVMLMFMLFVSSLCLSQESAAQGEWQFYRINAQYRGTVKKGFKSLGCAVAWFKDIDPEKLQAIIHVCALHPEKKNETYSFRLNLLLKRGAGQIAVEREIYSDFKGISGTERQSQIRQLCCLWAYIREYSKSGILNEKFVSDGAPVSLKVTKVRAGEEITCGWTEKKNFSGKFFLEKKNGSQFAIDKLRFKSGKLSVSIAADTAEKINKEFATREPFASTVFK